MTRETEAPTTREAGAPALRVQLERLERAAAVSGREAASQRYAASDRERSGERGSWPLSLSGPGTAAGFPDVTGRGGVGWSVGAGRYSPVSVGEQRWAEEADRVFRRDSRRYDGNFYLY